MGLPWFRMYVDFLECPKVQSLEFGDQRHFIAILALKSAGVIDQECQPAMMNRIVAQRLWLDRSEVDGVKARIIEAGLIDDDWQPIAWDRRQCVSDHDPTRAERQRRYRERNKQKRNALHNASDDATVTPLEESRREESKRKEGDAVAPRGSEPDLLWDEGLQYLMANSGSKEATLRTVLGRLIKTYGKSAVDVAMTDTIAAEPADPKAYLIGVLKKAKQAQEERAAKHKPNGTDHHTESDEPAMSQEEWAQRLYGASK